MITVYNNVRYIGVLVSSVLLYTIVCIQGEFNLFINSESRRGMHPFEVPQ